MKKGRYSEEQIIGFIKDAEAGMAVAALCRKHGFIDASFANGGLLPNFYFALSQL